MEEPMEDLTGVGKVAESVAKIADNQLANKAYDDLGGYLRARGWKLEDKLPTHFASLQYKDSQEVMKALAELGDTVRQQGPLDNKTAHLIQLAARQRSSRKGPYIAMPGRRPQPGQRPRRLPRVLGC